MLVPFSCVKNNAHKSDFIFIFFAFIHSEGRQKLCVDFNLMDFRIIDEDRSERGSNIWCRTRRLNLTEYDLHQCEMTGKVEKPNDARCAIIVMI